jgi:8-amino-7-oxononanoate synthase
MFKDCFVPRYDEGENMNSHLKHIKDKLEQRKSENALRELKINENLVDFCSNDYLGLASEAEIHVLEEVVSKTYGATGSRLISGNHKVTEEVEVFLAAYYKAESALIFNSGYNANIGVFSSLPQRGDTIIYDELIHASIRDGIKLSNAHSFSFKHNDINSLEEKIENAKGHVWIAVESIYSMDGDEAPLEELVNVSKKVDAALIVDEAHACGIFGAKGEGLVVEYGLENEVFARVATFGKALGLHGAVVLGNQLLREYLINYSRAFIYTTALPLPSVLAMKKAHTFLTNHLGRIEQLKELISYFKFNIQHSTFNIVQSDSSIQCIIVPGNAAVKKLAENVQNNGFDVRPILSPTVAKGEERLRICLHAFNTKSQIDGLIKAIEK